MMIARLWHGYTTPENASAYESIVQNEILPELRRIKGFLGGKLLRRELPGEVEFVSITYYSSLEAVRLATGATMGQAIVPDSAKAVLSRYDQRTAIFEVAIDENPPDTP